MAASEVRMSIGSLGFAGIGAATPLAQTKGTDADREAQESTAKEMQQQTDAQAEQAAGVGQTDGDEHETADRDADGRRLWELPAKKKAVAKATASVVEESTHSRDASGQCGNELDLTG
jgi:hypothetical protein